jgi:serralysin
MSGVKHNVPNTLTGNSLVDKVIAGGTVWDPAQGPVKVAIYNKTTSIWDFNALMAGRNGNPSDVVSHNEHTSYWKGNQGDYMFSAAAAFEAVSGIKFTTVGSSDADILWMAASFLRVGNKTQGLPNYGEGPTDRSVHQTWGFIADGGPYDFTGTTDGGYDFGSWSDPRGGIGFQNELAVVAQNLGLKVAGDNPFGSPFSLMSRNIVPKDSYKIGGYGFMKTPGAIDIAAVQALYGANMQTATGNDVYELPTANKAGVGWSTIWDAGGIDTISAAGSTTPVSINLNAASLDPNDPNGGGFLSRQINVYGGVSIAKGVTIENAIGGSGNDLLVGNGAANTLTGGNGNDTLYGNGGRDAFRFTVKPNSKTNFDTIYDYKKEDVIELSKSAFSKLKTKSGTLKSSEFWKGKAAHDPNDRIIYDSKKQTVSYDDDGTGSHKAVKILELKTKTMLTASEFVIV